MTVGDPSLRNVRRVSLRDVARRERFFFTPKFLHKVGDVVGVRRGYDLSILLQLRWTIERTFKED